MGTVTEFAKRNAVRRDFRFKHLLEKLNSYLQSGHAFSPQDLSNIAWAFTKIGLVGTELFGEICDLIVVQIGEFEPVNLSMTLWALAKAGSSEAKVFTAAIVEVRKQMPNFAPQQIANTTWAIAKAGFGDEDLYNTIAQVSLDQIEEFAVMNLSMLLYAFALAKCPHQRLFDEMGKKCTAETLAGTASVPHVVTNLAVAYAEVGIPNEEVFRSIAQASCLNLRDFRTQQIATLAQAFAKAGVHNPRLIERMNKAVVHRLEGFREQDLETLISAYESLGVSTKDIVKAMQGQQTSERQLAKVAIPLFVLLCLLALSWYRTL